MPGARHNLAMTNESVAFAIAFNERTSEYEVHLDGCKHLISSHLERMITMSASSGAAAAADYEDRNEGLRTRLGPCVKKAA